MARKPTQAVEEPKAKKQKVSPQLDENPVVRAPSRPIRKTKEESPVVETETEQWEDLDVGDEFDALMVSEYVVEIFEYLKELEVCIILSIFPSINIY